LGHGAGGGKQLPHDGAPPTEQTSRETEVRYSFTIKKTFIRIWNYSNNRPNIQTYALCTFTFSSQTSTIFS